jgi:hypothetical protein
LRAKQSTQSALSLVNIVTRFPLPVPLSAVSVESSPNGRFSCPAAARDGEQGESWPGRLAGRWVRGQVQISPNSRTLLVGNVAPKPSERLTTMTGDCQTHPNLVLSDEWGQSRREQAWTYIQSRLTALQVSPSQPTYLRGTYSSCQVNCEIVRLANFTGPW